MQPLSEAPWSLVEVAIEPMSREDREKLHGALAELVADDPSFRAKTDNESGQTILGGLSESHLDLKITILRDTYKVDANVGAPQVTYREKLARRVEQDYTHKKQIGGTAQFARVKIIFEPNEPGAGNVFESKIVGGSMPTKFIPGVEKGINSVMGSGVLAGFPVVDTKPRWSAEPFMTPTLRCWLSRSPPVRPFARRCRTAVLPSSSRS